MPNTTSFLSKYGEWIFRSLILIGIVANLWLTSNFVTRSEFESSNKQIREELATTTKETHTEFSVFVRENSTAHLAIQSAVADIAVAVKLLAANQLRLDDHESRIRLVERNQVEVMSRVSSIEKNNPK